MLCVPLQYTFAYTCHVSEPGAKRPPPQRRLQQLPALPHPLQLGGHLTQRAHQHGPPVPGVSLSPCPLDCLSVSRSLVAAANVLSLSVSCSLPAAADILSLPVSRSLPAVADVFSLSVSHSVPAAADILSLSVSRSLPACCRCLQPVCLSLSTSCSRHLEPVCLSLTAGCCRCLQPVCLSLSTSCSQRLEPVCLSLTAGCSQRPELCYCVDIRHYKRKTHGCSTFSCFGPLIWNSLPEKLRHCSILSSFKAKPENLPLLILFFTPANISTQFLHSRVCVCVCAIY